MKSSDILMTGIHPEGHRFVAIFVVASLVLFLIYAPLGWLGLIASAWCLYFFRDPDRIPPTESGILVSAGDGIVSSVGDVVFPADLEMCLGDASVSDAEFSGDQNGEGRQGYRRVSVFLSVFNVHVNRMPATGSIEKLVYVSGGFKDAASDTASDRNERQLIALKTEDQDIIGVAQVAGLVARRIICDLKEGQLTGRGQRFGLIRFGSRMDLYIPSNYDICVKPGQTMIGGESIVARRQA